MQAIFQYELTASLQNYVEAIYWISNSKKAARAKDISERMEVGKSSVTAALQTLSEKGIVNYAPYDVITLTEAGLAVARKLVRRHEVIRDFFVRVLSVDSEEADAAAGAMEHSVTDTILDRLIAFIEFVERCPQSGTAWIKDFGYHCDNDACSGDCDLCLADKDAQTTEQGNEAAQLRPSLARYGVGDRLVLIKVDDDSPMKERFRQIGAQLGAVIEIEHIDNDMRTMQIKLKGYHEQLAIEEAGKVLVQPVQGLVAARIQANDEINNKDEATRNESM